MEMRWRVRYLSFGNSASCSNGLIIYLPVEAVDYGLWSWPLRTFTTSRWIVALE